MAQRRRKRAGRRNGKGRSMPVIAGVVTVVLLSAAAFMVWQYVKAKQEIKAEPIESSLPRRDLSIKVDDVKKQTEEIQKEVEKQQKKQLIVIDAGHQKRGNSEKEPIGPGASEKKPKVASGTAGVATRRPEYEVTLEISKKLQTVLEERGYEVLMVRTENDVNISNAERAEIANQAKADAFLRLHCNGAESRSANGALTICMTKNSPYCADIYQDSKSLAEKVLDNLCSATGARRERVWETDSMSGINWSKVPVAIVEMGYMSNPEEDRKLSDAAYQERIVNGIADGVGQYFAEKGQ